MKQTIIYRYMGTNGIIDSPVHLEDIYFVRFFSLTADAGKVLTDGEKYVHTVKVPEEELELWSEVDDEGQK